LGIKQYLSDSHHIINAVVVALSDAVQLSEVDIFFPKTAIRRFFKVADITKLDEKYDNVIETEERADIYEAFYDLTYLTNDSV